MKRFIAPISVLVLAVSCMPAPAQTLTPFANRTCHEWNVLHQNATPDTKAADNWVFGYLDGVARYIDASNVLNGKPRTDILKGLDRKSIVTLVGKFCSGHPARHLDVVVSEIAGQSAAANRSVTRPFQARLLNGGRHQPVAETTGSAVTTTGSIGTAPVNPKCRTITVGSDTQPRHFRKCG